MRKKKLFLVAALCVASLAALAVTGSVLAVSTASGVNNSNTSSNCTPIDKETLAAAVSSSNSGTSGGAATPATAGATATPSASGSTATPSASGSTAIPSTSGTTATPGSTGSTGTGSSSATVMDSHETAYCVSGADVDVALSGGLTASVSAGSADSFATLPDQKAVGADINVSVDTANKTPASSAALEICMKDPQGFGTIYQWFTAQDWATWFKSTTTVARWVPLHTSHQNGLACAFSWIPGNFALDNP